MVTTARRRVALRSTRPTGSAGRLRKQKQRPTPWRSGCYARQAAREMKIPAVAIAGITAESVDEVIASGIRAVAVSSAVISADDVRAAAARIKARVM